MSPKFTINQKAALEKVIKKAGQEMLDKWPGQAKKQNLQIEIKSDGSSVTEADYASNTLLMNFLGEHYPDDGIISEEVPRDPAVADKLRVWIIDPLDGTQSFIDGKDDFSILVACVEKQKVILSCMYFPVLDCYCSAEIGGGAFINGQAIKVSPASTLREHSVYVRNFKANPSNVIYPEHMDSGRAFLAVARGEIDGAVMRMGRHKEWDLAAPALLITEAGGKITDELLEPVKFNEPDISYEYFVASNTQTHAAVLKLIPQKS